MARNPDRFSIQAQLARAYSDLESAKAEYSRQALRLAQHPRDADVQHVVADLEAEIEGHRRTIARLEAAQQADNHEVDQKQEAERIAEVKALCAKVRTITDQLDPLLVRIVEGLEAVGPDIAEFVTLAAQRHRAAHAAARLASNGKPPHSQLAHLIRADGHNALMDAVIGGVARSGIGTVGPSLAPHVVVNVPVRVPTLADAKQALERDRARLLEAINICTQSTTEEATA